MSRQGGPDRLAIIAGSGRLPLCVAEAARAREDEPYVFALTGESTVDWSAFDHTAIGLGDIARFKSEADRLGIGRIIMSGGVSRRPPLREIKLGLSGLFRIPTILRQLTAGGDNTVLTAVIAMLENDRRKVIGVQDVAPSLLAELGPVGAIAPDSDSQRDIAVAVQAARLLGRLDVGQGAIAVGGRIVALEGPEGTDAMIARVAGLKASGRISPRRRGVLVKLCKPGQDMRVDLPAAGLQTLKSAVDAGLAGIALEAGRSLLLDRDAARAFADSQGLFIHGLEPEAGGLGQ